MLFYIFGFVFLLVFFAFRRSYRNFCAGLREKPGIFFWFLTKIVELKGWSSEEFCLRTTDLESSSVLGFLNRNEIAERKFDRPKMLRAVPHRQLSQQAPDDIMNKMEDFMKSISIRRHGGSTLDENLLLRGKSVVEYSGADGLFLPNCDQTSFDKGEICHLHLNDGSFHMKLHSADAKLLIERKWAERFPLAGLKLGKVSIPQNYILIYAPQNDEDLQVWKKVLDAAIRYARQSR